MLCQAYLKVVLLLAALPLIIAQPVKQGQAVSGEMDKRDEVKARQYCKPPGDDCVSSQWWRVDRSPTQ
jgi:hypothetical protein